MAKNLCAKTVTPEEAYEVWRVANHPLFKGECLWFVLKKYQAPDKERGNEFARWMCAVKSSITAPGYDYGDVYISDITKTGAVKLAANPLTGKLIVTPGDAPAPVLAVPVMFVKPYQRGVVMLTHHSYSDAENTAARRKRQEAGD